MNNPQLYTFCIYLINKFVWKTRHKKDPWCLTLCDPIDGSPPGSAIPGILQARTLEWVAISFSNAGKWKVKVKSLSRVRLFATPWSAAHQAPPSMGFSRQEYWSGVPSPSPDDSTDVQKQTKLTCAAWLLRQRLTLVVEVRSRRVASEILYYFCFLIQICSVYK